MITQELILYKKFINGAILDAVSEIYDYANCTDGQICDNEQTIKDKISFVVNGLIEFSYMRGFSGDLWTTYLTFLLANNENPYSMACEIRGEVEGSINIAALHDFGIFKNLLDIDIVGLFESFGSCGYEFIKDYDGGNDEGRVFNKRVRDRIMDLASKIKDAENPNEIKDMVTAFYKDFGVGKFGLHKAFRVDHNTNGETLVLPITNIAHVGLDDLIGYESQKKKLIDNTEAFISGKPCNNCLLFGEAGTGKSSSIKAILNKYYDQGLRIIEVYKHQFKDLNDVIAQIKNRNYRFIIYMDDLSFEEFEVEYKYLKAVIEGGLEKKPENVLIYATSNRRHLVRESFNDRNDYDDDLHSSDTKQEKMSLSSRFGVTIYFPSPEKKEFNTIVKELAARYNISMEENELILKANAWEIAHGGLSGRTASQFIDYLRGQSL
ncbi:MAG: ATP-binding protein [Lachnospiraceae bacterium]|nr:ATP-binding protein [Lachnospiraceae bacterium]